MKYPLFFYVAFVLGIHTHSGKRTKSYFTACGVLCLTFLIFNNVKTVYDVVLKRSNSFVMLMIFYRAFINLYLVIAGLQDFKSDRINCGKIFSKLPEMKRQMIDKSLLLKFVSLFLLGLPDIIIRAQLRSSSIKIWVLVFLTGFVSRLVCIITLMKLVLLREAEQISYSALQDEISRTHPRTALFTISTLRVRHFEICEFHKHINDAFSLRMFFFVIMLYVGTLNSAHDLIENVLLGRFNNATIISIYSILDFLYTVLILTSSSANTSKQVSSF